MQFKKLEFANRYQYHPERLAASALRIRISDIKKILCLQNRDYQPEGIPRLSASQCPPYCQNL